MRFAADLRADPPGLLRAQWRDPLRAPRPLRAFAERAGQPSETGKTVDKTHDDDHDLTWSRHLHCGRSIPWVSMT